MTDQILIDNLTNVSRGALIGYMFVTAWRLMTRRHDIDSPKGACRILGILHLLMGFIICDTIGAWWPSIYADYHYGRITSTFDIILMPCWGIFIIEMLRLSKLTTRKILAHISPFVVVSILYIATYSEYIFFADVLAAIGYCSYWLTRFVISSRNYNKRLTDNYSDIQNRDMKWIVNVASLMFLNMLMWFICFVMEYRYLEGVYYLVVMFIWGTVCYYVERMRSIEVMPTEEEDKQENLEMLATLDEEALNPNREENAAFREKLYQLCKEHNFFQKEDLTRDDLANAMGTNHTYFTRKLKEATGLSFYDYINSLRIEESIELLMNTELSVEDIAMQCGFKSKSSFYRAFDKIHGCTPKEYKYNNTID